MFKKFPTISWFKYLALIWAFIFFTNGAEGNIYPAVKPLNIKSVLVIDGGVEIYGEIERLRPLCGFRKVEWFLGSYKEKNIPAIFEFRGKNYIRPDGVTQFGPWFVDAKDENTLMNYSYAFAYHKCLIKIMSYKITLPWLTRSQLHPRKFFN